LYDEWFEKADDWFKSGFSEKFFEKRHFFFKERLLHENFTVDLKISGFFAEKRRSA
jgi:hypothetical protein